MARSKKILDTKPKTQINNLLASLLKSTGNKYASIVSDGTVADASEWIDTLCYALNMQISGDLFKGLPVGHPIEVAGESGTAKTYYMMSLVDSFLKTYQESLVLIFDSEAGINKERLEGRGIDTTRVGYVTVENLPHLRTQLMTTLADINNPEDTKYKGIKIMFVIDSIGQPPSAKEEKDAIERSDSQDMTRAKFIRSIFRLLRSKLLKNKVTLLVSNHIYMKVSGNQYEDPRVIAGGGGHIFFCDYVVMLSRAQYKEGEVRTGNIVTTTMQKSRDTQPFTKVKSLLSFKHGLHRYYPMADWAVEAGIWTKERGGFGIDGKTVSEADIYREGETYFTKEVLDRINVFKKPQFEYGDKTSDTMFKSEEPQDANA